MKEKTDWSELNRSILDRLDIAEIYRSWGIKITGTSPNDKGWLSCKAAGREDKNPSAGINVGNGPARGRYNDFGGNVSLNLWESGAKFGNLGTWDAARKALAEKVGVTLPSGPRPKESKDSIEFLRWSENSIKLFCEKKKHITAKAIREAGGKLAKYPKKAPDQFAQYVIAFPAFSAAGVWDDDPTGYVILNTNGGAVEIYQGKGKPTKSTKVATVGGKSGLLNKWAVARIETAEVIWKVEGITDALALHALIPLELRETHIVITNAGGCMEDIRPDWPGLFAGKTVYVIHDQDKPGQMGAAKWLAALAALSLVKNVQLPYPLTENHGKDVRDWLDEEKTYQDFLLLAEQFQFITPTTAPKVLSPEETLLSSIKLMVMGQYENGAIETFSFSEDRRRTSKIPNIDRIGYPTILQVCGNPAKDLVTDSKEVPPGQYGVSEVKNAIALIGGSRNLTNHPPLGKGLWSVKGTTVVVNDIEAATVDLEHKELMPLEFPLLENQVIDFSAPEPWCDFKKLNGYLKIADNEWSEDVLNEACMIFEKWNWRHHLDSVVAASLLCCSFMQTCWPWRPLVLITGPSDCGKSTLLKTINSVAGKLVEMAAKPSEAGIRQKVKNNACILVIDEFENDRYRQGVFELLRTSSQGGNTLRGTSDQKGISYRMQHICWVACIESGLKREADRNRNIILDMDRPKLGTRGKLSLPSQASLYDLGHKLLAVSIVNFPRAVQIFESIKSVQIPEIEGRLVENYAVPAAMVAAIRGLSPEQSRQQLEEMVEGRIDIIGSGESDEISLLSDILESFVDLGGGNKKSVSEIISSVGEYRECRDHIQRHGVSLVSGTSGTYLEDQEFKYIFINPKSVQRQLLKGTDWAQMTIDQILLRLDGAYRTRQRLSGKSTRGVAVPMENVIGSADAETEAEDAY